MVFIGCYYNSLISESQLIIDGKTALILSDKLIPPDQQIALHL